MGVAICPAPPAREVPKPKGKAPKPIKLDATQGRLLSNRLYRVVCSYGWEGDCKALIRDGLVKYRADQDGTELELRKAAAYPPGGLLTLMHRCCRCRRWHPP